MRITVTNQQDQPIEGVRVQVLDGPVSVSDKASTTDLDGMIWLGQLTMPGQYTVLLTYQQKQVRDTIQFRPGQPATVKVW